MDGSQTDDLCWNLKCEPAQFALDHDGWLSAPDIETRWGMPGMSGGGGSNKKKGKGQLYRPDARFWGQI